MTPRVKQVRTYFIVRNARVGCDQERCHALREISGVLGVLGRAVTLREPEQIVRDGDGQRGLGEVLIEVDGRRQRHVV